VVVVVVVVVTVVVMVVTVVVAVEVVGGVHDVTGEGPEGPCCMQYWSVGKPAMPGIVHAFKS
jgi:hypothetical protein